MPRALVSFSGETSGGKSATRTHTRARARAHTRTHTPRRMTSAAAAAHRAPSRRLQGLGTALARRRGPPAVCARTLGWGLRACAASVAARSARGRTTLRVPTMGTAWDRHYCVAPRSAVPAVPGVAAEVQLQCRYERLWFSHAAHPTPGRSTPPPAAMRGRSPRRRRMAAGQKSRVRRLDRSLPVLRCRLDNGVPAIPAPACESCCESECRIPMDIPDANVRRGRHRQPKKSPRERELLGGAAGGEGTGRRARQGARRAPRRERRERREKSAEGARAQETREMPPAS